MKITETYKQHAVQQTAKGQFIVYATIEKSDNFPDGIGLPASQTRHGTVEEARAEIDSIIERHAKWEHEAEVAIAAEKKLMMENPTLAERQIAYQKRMHEAYGDICAAERRSAAADRHLGSLTGISAEHLNSRSSYQDERNQEILLAKRLYDQLSDIHCQSRICRDTGNNEGWERAIVHAEKYLDEIEKMNVM